MARKPRVEVEGGLYHIITRGNDRQEIFHSVADHQKFLSLLVLQKQRTPFFLYAYCLMTNHVHLLIERQADTVGRIMQRVLTGYSQYYNRRYKRVGHVFQGRHKAILCQSDKYLGELVRYIHLNPVRARMVGQPEEYLYSSHRAYMGLEPAGIVDVDPVLRLFGVVRQIAGERFAEYVAAGIGSKFSGDLDSPADYDVLGSEEFVDSMIHRFGDGAERKRQKKAERAFDPETLVAAVEAVFGLPRKRFCGSAKNSQAVFAKEVLILTGIEAGASITDISKIIDLDTSNISRRCDAAKLKTETDTKLTYARNLVSKIYHEKIAESQV